MLLYQTGTRSKRGKKKKELASEGMEDIDKQVRKKQSEASRDVLRAAADGGWGLCECVQEMWGSDEALYEASSDQDFNPEG